MGAAHLERSMVTMQQTKVTLHSDEEQMTFEWPINSAQVLITSTCLPLPVVVDVEEAAQVFEALIDQGCY
jgi:hypothetical protein